MKFTVFVIQNFLLMLIMGTVYTWSVFRVSVETRFGLGALESGLPYMVSLFFYAVSMMVSGRFLTINNTRKHAFFGTLMIGLGWGVSALAPNLWILMLGYGVLMGYGVGLVYGVPVFLLNKTSQRSGLFTGIVLAGFGASPLITAPMVRAILEATDLGFTFLLMSVVAFVVMVPMTMNLKVDQNRILVKEDTPTQMNPRVFVVFYGLFVGATTIGLMMIGLSYRLGVVNYDFASRETALALSFFAFLNGIARPIYGYLMDRFSFVFVASSSLALLVIASVIGILNQGNVLTWFVMSMGIYWFNLGAWLAIIPALVKQTFGTYRYAQRYGTLFTAYGLGAIIGTVLSGFILDVFTSTVNLYLLVLWIVLMMLAGVLVYHKGQHKEHASSKP